MTGRGWNSRRYISLCRALSAWMTKEPRQFNYSRQRQGRCVRKAQGWSRQRPTLGQTIVYVGNPNGVEALRHPCHNPFRVVVSMSLVPRVDATRQPWAAGHYAVGVEETKCPCAVGVEDIKEQYAVGVEANQPISVDWHRADQGCSPCFPSDLRGTMWFMPLGNERAAQTDRNRGCENFEVIPASVARCCTWNRRAGSVRMAA